MCVIWLSKFIILSVLEKIISVSTNSMNQEIYLLWSLAINVCKEMGLFLDFILRSLGICLMSDG